MKIFFSKTFLTSLLMLLALLAAACQPIAPAVQPAGDKTQPVESAGASVEGAPEAATTDSVVHLTILHLNDVYEITPVSGGAWGGLARIATLRNQLAEANPNTIVVLAGDLYTPSAMSSAVVDGTPLDGEQAVAVLNAVGLDYMTFGDHEFHVSSEDEFYQRLSETTFPILSGNILDADGEAFPGVVPNAVFTVANEAGEEITVGIFGITEELGETPVAHTYRDPMEVATEQVAALADETDVIIALTHFHVPIDVETAQAFPDIDLILGGDDHENMAVESGPDTAMIYKSDANVRNVYVLDLYYDTATDDLTIEAYIQPIIDEIVDDPETQAVVDKWVEVAFDAFRAEGVAPEELVTQAPFDLDGFASSIRNHPTDLTNLVAEGMRNAATGAQAALYYSGNLRLDDLIPAGADVLQYDLIRAFPTNYQVVAVEAPGQFIIENLDSGLSSAGTGGYTLNTDNITVADDGTYLLDGEPIDPVSTYTLAIFDNLVYGDVVVLEEVGTVRDILAQQLRAASE